jgi:elongation factor P hydroxylase
MIDKFTNFEVEIFNECRPNSTYYIYILFKGDLRPLYITTEPLFPYLHGADFN